MGKAFKQRKKTAPVAKDELDESLAVFAARKGFLNTAVTMGWQLAITVLVPVVIGVQLDKRFDSSPSYTLVALILAIAMSIGVVAKTIKEVNKQQEDKH